MIKIGDKVVCINGVMNPEALKECVFPDGYPEEGKIYVIREILFFDFRDKPKTLSLYLIGLREIYNGKEIPWNAESFRKLEDVKMENELRALRGQYYE